MAISVKHAQLQQDHFRVLVKRSVQVVVQCKMKADEGYQVTMITIKYYLLLIETTSRDFYSVDENGSHSYVETVME